MNKLDDILELTPEEKLLLKNIRKHDMTSEELKTFARGLQHPDRAQLKVYDHSRKGTTFRFGLIGDTHMGNKSFNPDALADFYDRLKHGGIKEVYHAGDLVDGLHVHRGQEYELYALGMEQQAKDVIENYPKRRGIKTFYILGNHDNWYKQNAGADISKIIDAERSDMECLGDSEADVIIGNKTKLRLIHPGGGSSYALSYKPQKLIESLSGGTKPNIMGIGHYHKMIQMVYRNIHAFLTGCFEEQTPFMRSKNLMAHVGGWIIEGESGKKGGIKYLTATFVPYMKG